MPLSVGGAGSPSNTISPGPRSTSTLNGVLIHLTVWPQYTNVTHRQTDRTDRTDNGPIAYRANRFTNGRPTKENQVVVFHQVASLHIIKLN